MLKFQERLQEVAKMPDLIDLQLLMYDKLTQKQYNKFRNIFLQKLPTDKPASQKP